MILKSTRQCGTDLMQKEIWMRLNFDQNFEANLDAKGDLWVSCRQKCRANAWQAEPAVHVSATIARLFAS